MANMGWYQDELYERAQERWIENFIDDNGREPTEEEIEAATEDAYESYISGLADSAYDRMKEGD
jgi:hypothetical protein